MEILIIIFLILLNGVFSMSEIALVSARKYKLENAIKKGDKNAKKALGLASNPNTFLSTVQIGITLIGILTGIYSGEKITEDLEAFVSRAEFLQPYANTLAVILVVIIITYFSIVFGELLPKRIGLLFPEKIATLMAAPMHLISKIASPFIWLLTKTNDLALRVLGIKEKSGSWVTEEEVKAMIQNSAEGGDIQKIEQNIVQRVFALGDRRISELMTHKSDLIWFDITDDLSTVKAKSQNDIHSVYPVSRGGRLDDLAGIVFVKELFMRNTGSGTFNLSDYLRQPLIVHDNTPAYKTLEKFKEAKAHYAMVVDEYGSVQGIVSMDDIMDALVGDVSENVQDEYQVVERDENSWLADAQYPYFELLNYFGISGNEDEDVEGEFNTIAGLILNHFGRIPTIGEKMPWRGFEIEVIDMDAMRIDKVLITRKKETR